MDLRALLDEFERRCGVPLWDDSCEERVWASQWIQLHGTEPVTAAPHAGYFWDAQQQGNVFLASFGGPPGDVYVELAQPYLAPWYRRLVWILSRVPELKPGVVFVCEDRGLQCELAFAVAGPEDDIPQGQGRVWKRLLLLSPDEREALEEKTASLRDLTEWARVADLRRRCSRRPGRTLVPEEALEQLCENSAKTLMRRRMRHERLVEFNAALVMIEHERRALLELERLIAALRTAD